ncbi:hypothetical protein ACWDBO_24695 [Streptomyces mirabilis]|uniref:hypothetical protein n=1 Tax=Streptomyces mirabilis TaxID=68239 RepID=UPI0031BA29B7
MLEPPLPDDPPDVPLDELPPLLLDPLPAAGAALAVTVTFTVTVCVAVTVGAGFAVSVAVAVAVTVAVAVGRTVSDADFVLLLFCPLPPAPTPRKKANPIAGRTYRFRAHFALGGRWAGAGGNGGGWLYDKVPPRAVRGEVTVTGGVKKA